MAVPLRAWDRERQNREVLTWTKAALLGQADTPEDRLERCHWVDGVMLARAYQERFPWIHTLKPDELTGLLDAVHARMDHLTITGSLNRELHDHQY
nr:Fe-only/vanadium nitrogenase subunit delta [uncultured Holophaga sp.]